MMTTIFKRIFRLPEMIILLSLAALACLPLGLNSLVRDASSSLLLPITIIGALLTWILITQNARNLSTGIILLILGPLVLFIRIGQMSRQLLEATQQTFLFYMILFRTKAYVEPSPLLSARADLVQRIFALANRLASWFNAALHGIQIEDPVVRTLLWSLALWMIAVWAGWQIYRNKRLLTGMLPSTVVLIFILDYTGKETQVLWLHLALLLFLAGLTSYANLQARWHITKTDYAESTSMDTIIAVGVLALGLTAISFFSYNISVKDILENLRDRNKPSNSADAQARPPEKSTSHYTTMGFDGGLPRSYLMRSGPELSRQLVMTISTGDLPPLPAVANPNVPRYYWRTFTYQVYTGFGWTNPPVTSEGISSEQSLIDTTSANYRVVNQQVTFPDDSAGRLYWTGVLTQADIPFQAAWLRKDKTNPLLNSDLLAALASVNTYRAQSLLLNVNASQLRASPSVYPDWVRKQFLELPETVPERVLSLARDLTASELTPYDRALAIQNYLRTFPYTLDVKGPPLGRDVADYFLFDLKQGYCDYYATTMVVLARAAGLPARLVVGYANGSYDLEQAHYTVTENYAHSWVEIYFANIGWVQFEPTAGQPAIVYTDASDAEQTTPPAQPATISLSKRFNDFFNGINLSLPALFILLVGLLWAGLDALYLAGLQPARTVQILYGRLRRLARPLSGSSSKGQTAYQFALMLINKLNSLSVPSWLRGIISVSRNEISQLTDFYSDSLFAPSPLTHADARAALKIWRQLRWRLILADIFALIESTRRGMAENAASNFQGDRPR